MKIKKTGIANLTRQIKLKWCSIRKHTVEEYPKDCDWKRERERDSDIQPLAQWLRSDFQRLNR